MQADQPVRVVQAWQDAANAQDAEQLLAVSDPNIEIVGPRGTARGHAILRDWLARAGLTLQTQRMFARADQIVVAQHGVWRAVGTGEVAGAADVASHFRVRDGRVTYFARYDELDQALAAAGLNAADQIELD